MIEDAQLIDHPTLAENGIVAEGVTRSFGDVWAVRGMDLVVPYGQVTALVGPNGAGKTTLMLMLATLLTPTAGRLRIAGVDPAVDPVAVRRVTGWMPDTLGMYDQLKVHEYLEFFAEAHRLSKADKARAVPELLNTVRLYEYGKAPVHVLSRGQKQRLALARALIHRPRVLLLDEPASGLDPRSRIELRDLLRRLAADGAAILVSSHILSELAEMADRAVFVSAGQVVASREMTELAAVGADQLIAWRIRARDPKALESALVERGLSGGAVTPAGFELPPMTEDQASDLLAEVVGAGVRVLAFGPVGTPLESAYLALTEERR
ncbi:MAG: ABC transporter ATP-binding protein [Catenulisporales bacterium]|nr:ABC transporter ATP-binding protein [Catenulisporales bacterium]